MKGLIIVAFGLLPSFACFGQQDSVATNDTTQTILLIKPNPHIKLYQQQLGKLHNHKAFFCRLEDDLSTKSFRVNIGLDVK